MLVYAADADSQFHAACRDWLERQRARPDAWYTSWGILYEFSAGNNPPKSHATAVDRTSGVGVRNGSAWFSGLAVLVDELDARFACCLTLLLVPLS